MIVSCFYYSIFPGIMQEKNLLFRECISPKQDLFPLRAYLLVILIFFLCFRSEIVLLHQYA